jgi:hypothetical protein
MAGMITDSDGPLEPAPADLDISATKKASARRHFVAFWLLKDR